MEDFTRTATGVGLPLQGPHWAEQVEDALPASFTPLKLVTQPSGLVVELKRPDMLLGRHTDADLRLPMPDVSRRHCRFVFTDGSWQVVDLDSLNGVMVNGQRVKQATLRHWDLVVIGGFKFRVDLEAPPSNAPEAPGDSANRDEMESVAGGVPLPAHEAGPSQRKAS
jgi:predicted component of type VI protein secretion system